MTFGMNAEKSFQNPYSWITLPMKAHPNKTRKKPRKKQKDAIFFSRRKKNLIVFWYPNKNIKPTINDRLPNDRSVRSNINITPRKIHTLPIRHRPIPISNDELGEMIK